MKKLLFSLGLFLTTYFVSGYIFTAIGTNSNVRTMYVDTVNNILYVGGDFDSVGGISASSVAKFDGNSWSAVGMGVSGAVISIISFNNEIYMGGAFINLYDSTETNLVKWDSSVNNLVGIEMISAGGDSIIGPVFSLTVYNSELYVAGYIYSPNNTAYNSIVRFNGNNWLDVGGGANNAIFSMAIFESYLFASGAFHSIGGINVMEIAKWDGNSWHSLGTDAFMFCPGAWSTKWIMGQYNGSLYVSSVSYVPTSIVQDTSNIFKLTGNQWESVDGLVNYDTSWGCVLSSIFSSSIVPFDSGFVVGGYFSSSYFPPSLVGNNIVMFSNNSWNSLSGGANGNINSLSVFNGELYIGGYFDSIGGIASTNFAKMSNLILPLELLSFTGENQGDVNVLKWETASEVDVDHYLIEKSDDGVSFGELGRVVAYGNTGINKYQSIDNNPREGITYYCLTEVGFGGKTGYEKIIAVEKKAKSFAELYPNLVTDNFILIINSPELEKGIPLQIFNSSGQEIRTQKITDKVTVIEKDNFPAGVYFYRLGELKNGKLVFR